VNERQARLEQFVREVAMYGHEPGAMQVLIDVARTLVAENSQPQTQDGIFTLTSRQQRTNRVSG
jgi:hypothetical protein